MKKIYFGSNLKMYKGIKETEEYLKKLKENTGNISRENVELYGFIYCCDVLRQQQYNHRCSEYVLGRSGTVYGRNFTVHVGRTGGKTGDDRSF